MLPPNIEQKYQKLTELIRALGSAVVAYSGGTDSTLLAVVCHKVLGDKMRAITAQSETYARHELEDAVRIARQFNFPHEVIQTSELGIPSFSDNPINRCYFCKKELFKKLKAIADKKNDAYVVDGTTLSDEGDFRPGRQAAIELGVRSPLLEAGLGKEEVRTLSQFLGLPTWNKPAYACLASRFPYGEKINQEKLNTLEQAEEFLRDLGFKQVRVRWHAKIARIEVEPEEINRLAEGKTRNLIVNKFLSLGFLYVTIDLEGYRSGSMNREIEKNELEGFEHAEHAGEAENEETNHMSCPRCKDKKLEKVVAKDARFKQCHHCGGSWFNLNELEKAIGKKIKFMLPSGTKASEAFSYSNKPICPTCHAPLIHIKSFDFAEIGIEACIICQGRWVDGTEIEKLQNRGLLTQVKNFVMRLF
jgi:uncharacterized protein